MPALPGSVFSLALKTRYSRSVAGVRARHVRCTMKIDSKDFRVRESKDVNLKKSPTDEKQKELRRIRKLLAK